MQIADAIKRSAEPWRLAVCTAVLGFLALGAATHSFHVYHLFTLLAIPGALFASEAGRRFFVQWGPLMATWIAYDRFRLIQPSLLSRVGVAWPYDLERMLFGWMAGGRAPAHAAHEWLVAHAASPVWHGVGLFFAAVYVSHLFSYPLLFLVWWLRSRSDVRWRDRFVRHAIGFALLNAVGFIGYVLVPAAPPWWVTLYGTAQPTASLVSHADLDAAMSVHLIARTIETAPNWFAAVPSLHGAYPVLLFLLAWRDRNRLWLATIALYGAAMWTATVVLNLHYVVDLLAGAAVAVLAWYLVRAVEGRGWLERFQ